MFTTAIIAFREFFEAFLVVGMFLGVSRKLKIKKELEIIFASVVGIIFSLGISAATYFLGDKARAVLTENRAEILGNYLLLFSGFFLAYVVFSLHQRMSHDKKEIMSRAATRLEKRVFDFSLFLTIIFLVTREGFEIAIFTASASLFTVFIQNFAGLLIGFMLAGITGAIAFVAYARFPIKKIFKITEYVIVVLGAAMVQVGTTGLLKNQFGINIGNKVLNLRFIPSDESILGHFIQSFTGIDREISFTRILIMALYMTIVYTIVWHKRKTTNEK